eukprot:TRINITY_DN61084_c0_g1_i1.p1 TRINITY_DN61084_c0_g1~~TRINITY_DN61084_c0_g1_i1.p1  ORF type:complete len:948 (-),score=131.73 TRINITY_DN61084_c0_g1_i1:83-2926(-)
MKLVGLVLVVTALGLKESQIPLRFPKVPVSPDYNFGAVAEKPIRIGSITGVKVDSTQTIGVQSGNDSVRIQFYRDDVVRIWVGWEGNFSDPASDDIVVAIPDTSLTPSVQDKGDYYEMQASANSTVTLRAMKSPLRLSMYRAGVKVWEETVGLSRNTTGTFQTLGSSADEYFFGGGMQNGRFSHKGHRIRVSVDGNWAEGGNPNAAPFWLSSNGFGVYRNTWSPGFYDFSESPGVFAHNESRFDAFYFVSTPRNFRGVLEGYTFVTGRPFMPPIYGLGLGDSDCYHNSRHGNDTHVVIAVADKYRQLDMPGAWILPNDGYGCGYGKGPEKFPTELPILVDVIQQLKERGFQSGLWSSTGLPDFPGEVKGGVRVGKTDVGWIGSGYKYAFDSCKLVADGIEKNSDGRRFIWTVEGWAGTQRLAVMWTGDDSGGFDYLRWQIPTFVGCGFSSQAHVSGDIDGIFGGSPETYVRDLQMKSMMTVLMTMSGWASNPDKQPWTWGEPFTSINRMYLKLKMRLLPYMYTLSREAYETGFPPVRAMALEFPNDDTTFVRSSFTSQQFMAGPWFLVAPVYRPLAETRTRDGIYLPAGDWIDYWNWDSIISGPTTVNGYDAPLDRLPMFVRAGAIVPMWPEMLYPGEKRVDPLTLEVFPTGTTSFELYEDDGITRRALEGSEYAKTIIKSIASSTALSTGGRVRVIVGASVLRFDGQLSLRSYDFRIHAPHEPFEVLLESNAAGAEAGEIIKLPKKGSLSELDYAESGWFFVQGFTGNKKGGVVVVKTSKIFITKSFSVSLTTGPHVPHITLKSCSSSQNNSQQFAYCSMSGLITMRSNSSACLSVGADKDPASGTPTLEILPCSSGDPQQQWDFNGGFLKLRSGAFGCVDLDTTDFRAEMYSCGSSLRSNQNWTFNSTTGHITTYLDGRCMTAAFLTTSPTSVDAAKKPDTIAVV